VDALAADVDVVVEGGIGGPGDPAACFERIILLMKIGATINTNFSVIRLTVNFPAIAAAHPNTSGSA
jgi:hypothetical protein